VQAVKSYPVQLSGRRDPATAVLRMARRRGGDSDVADGVTTRWRVRQAGLRVRGRSLPCRPPVVPWRDCDVMSARGWRWVDRVL